MNWIREVILKNLALKGLALLLAFLVWHQVTSREIIQGRVVLPITFVNIPPSTEVLLNDSDRRVEVDLRSDRGSEVLDERNLAVVVDLKPYRTGEDQSIQLNDSNINRPSGVDVVGITPPRIRLKLETTRRKTTTIEPLVVGEPAEGYQVTSIEVSPAQITVVGPESQVEPFTTAVTDQIDLAGRSQSFAQPTFIDLEAHPRLRIENSAEVVVRIGIEEKRKNVRIRGLTVKVVPEGSQARLEPRQIDLEGTVPVSFSERLDGKGFEAVVDVSNLEIRSEPYEVSPQIVVPPQYESIFRLVRRTPPQIKVRKTG